MADHNRLYRFKVVENSSIGKYFDSLSDALTYARSRSDWFFSHYTSFQSWSVSVFYPNGRKHSQYKGKGSQ